eukprot:SAG11_NODE_1322_length_5207_cov_3.093187_3_plen_108_part_00
MRPAERILPIVRAAKCPRVDKSNGCVRWIDVGDSGGRTACDAIILDVVIRRFCAAYNSATLADSAPIRFAARSVSPAAISSAALQSFPSRPPNILVSASEASAQRSA